MQLDEELLDFYCDHYECDRDGRPIYQKRNLKGTKMNRRTLKLNIKKVENELDEMRKQLTTTKVTLEGGSGYVFDSYGDVSSKTCLTDTAIGTTYGLLRSDKHLAKRAGKNMVTRNRLEAYVHQIQKGGGGEWTIYLNGIGEYVPIEPDEKYLCMVMMEEETAYEIADALNDLDRTWKL